MTEPKKSLCNDLADQAEFMDAGDQTVGILNIDQKGIYTELIIEEFSELLDAIESEPLVNQLKEAIDLKVVVNGFIHSMCTDGELAWKAVHANNMKKVEFPPVKDANGKIQKSKESIAQKEEMMDILEKLVCD